MITAVDNIAPTSSPTRGDLEAWQVSRPTNDPICSTQMGSFVVVAWPSSAIGYLDDRYRSAPTRIDPHYLKKRPHPRKQPCSKSRSPAPQVGSPDAKLSPPVGRPGSAAATPAPVRIIPLSTAVVAKERMITPRMVSPQVRVVGQIVAIEQHLQRQRMPRCLGLLDLVVHPPIAANDPTLVSGPVRCCYRCYTDRVTR